MLSELRQSERDGGDNPTMMVNENASDLGSDDEINTAGGTSGRLVFSEEDHKDTKPRPRKLGLTGHTADNGYSDVPQDEVDEALYTAPGNGEDEDEDKVGPQRRASNNNAHSAAVS